MLQACIKSISFNIKKFWRHYFIENYQLLEYPKIFQKIEVVICFETQFLKTILNESQTISLKLYTCSEAIMLWRQNMASELIIFRLFLKKPDYYLKLLFRKY
jgi:hypothetical protein